MGTCNTLFGTLAALTFAGAATAAPVDHLLGTYQSQGAGAFSAERGAQAWSAGHRPEGSQARSCASCHGADLTRPGKHLRTGKRIEPMAPSVNAARLTDQAKVVKWLQRNCKWTLGRECTPQEKGDFLTYVRSR